MIHLYSLNLTGCIITQSPSLYQIWQVHCISSGILNFAACYEVQSGPLPHPPFSIPGVTRCDLSRIAD